MNNNAKLTASVADLPSLPELLVNDLLQILLNHPDGINEHQLLHQLDALGYSVFKPDLDPLKLFQAHFLLFHLLYRQADFWQAEHGVLRIHCLDIGFTPSVASSADQSDASDQLQTDDPLRRYYLDYRHFLETQSEDVQNLLDDFWKAFYQIQPSEQLTQAMQVLELPLDLPLTQSAVTRQYRKLSLIHHPDRGGDTAKFQRISQAAQQLRDHLVHQ